MAKSDPFGDLMSGVPRGVATKFLKDQLPPQARWMNPEDIARHPLLAYDPDDPGGKILIGRIGERLLGIEDNRHMMTVAGSRSGKSVGVISNLLFYDGSTFCIDPKGELASVTARRRRELGQKVFVLDPFKRAKGAAAGMRARYNPLSVLTAENPFLIEDAVQITDALIVRSKEERDPHWNESAAALISGLMLYVALGDDVEDARRHLGTVRTLIRNALNTDDAGKYAVPKRVLAAADRLASDGFEDDAAAIEGAVRGFYDKPENERGSVLSTANRHTQFLDYRSMRDVLAGHDFDLRDLKRDPDGLSVYLCLPAMRMGMCNRWLRLMINQLLDAMEREETRPAAPVLACLDEFPVLGPMTALQDAAGQVASFGVKLWVILQDWGQGQSLYGDRWESFAANSGVFQAFGNTDVMTTEYLSRRLGETRVLATRKAEAGPQERAKGLSGRTEDAQSFSLMSPDEIRRVFGREDELRRQMVIWGRYNPMVLQRVEYYDPSAPTWTVFQGTFDTP